MVGSLFSFRIQPFLCNEGIEDDMTRVTYQGQCAAAARARAAQDREIHVFRRNRVQPGGSFVKTVDLGVMTNRKYKSLKETDITVYVGCFTDCGDGYARFVAFYLNEIEGQVA